MDISMNACIHKARKPLSSLSLQRPRLSLALCDVHERESVKVFQVFGLGSVVRRGCPHALASSLGAEFVPGNEDVPKPVLTARRVENLRLVGVASPHLDDGVRDYGGASLGMSIVRTRGLPMLRSSTSMVEAMSAKC